MARLREQHGPTDARQCGKEAQLGRWVSEWLPQTEPTRRA